MGATEVIKLHKVVAFHVRFAVTTTTPTTATLTTTTSPTTTTAATTTTTPTTTTAATTTTTPTTTTAATTDVSLPPTGDIQQYSLETARSVRLHRNAYGPLHVPLASATYDQADQTLTLTPTAPAPVRRYRLVKQGSFELSDLPGRQVNWHVLFEPPNPHPSHGSSDWYDYLDPLVWPALIVCSHGC